MSHKTLPYVRIKIKHVILHDEGNYCKKLHILEYYYKYSIFCKIFKKKSFNKSRKCSKNFLV